MADDDIAELQTLLTLSISKFEQGWQRAQAVTEKAAAGVEKRTAAASANMAKSLNGALNNISARNPSAAVDGLTKSFRLNNLQLMELGHSARSTFDILAAGQSPLRALQLEGARLIQTPASGEGGIGGAIEGIGATVAGLATPINLAIAAIAALGVGTVLWLTHEQSATVDATAALAAHKKWLDQILDGYDATKKAADVYLAAANKLPEGAVSSDLNAQTAPAMKNLQTALDQLKSYRDELTQDLAQGVQEFGSQGAADSVAHLVDVVKQAGLSATSSKGQFDALVTSLTEIKNGADQFGPTEAFLAGKMLDLVTNAEKARAAVDSIGVSLNNLPTSISVQIGVEMKGFDDARKKLLGLVPDTRDEFTRARDNAKLDYNQMLGAAPDDIMRQAATGDYQKTLAGIDAAQKAAEAKKSGAKSESAAERQAKAIDKTTASLQRQIAALGESGKAQAEANALAEAGITADDKRAGSVEALAGQLYDAKAALDANNQAASLFASTTANAFEGPVSGTKTLTSALSDLASAFSQNLLQAALLGQGPFAGWLGTSSSTPGAPAGLFGTLFGSLFGLGGPSAGLAWAAPAFPAYAGGGAVSGPGGPTSDAIPAFLSNGEYIIRASAAAKFGPLLDAINSGRIGRFANGGTVGSTPVRPAAATSVPSSMVSISPTINVNATGGSQEANSDLAKKVGAEVVNQFGALFNQHLMQAARPGNPLFQMMRGSL